MTKLKTSEASTPSTANQAADMTRRMVCGGLAGMIAKTATNPLERIKMLSQTGEYGATGKKSVSVHDLYRSIIRNEGVIGLWAGNGANLLRVFPVSFFPSFTYFFRTVQKCNVIYVLQYQGMQSYLM